MRRKRAPELGPNRFIVRRDEHERALSRLRRHVALWPQCNRTEQDDEQRERENGVLHPGRATASSGSTLA
jgi:hypothetical protein